MTGPARLLISIFRVKLKPPVFVVGCGHSGTSLLLAILGAHSKIHAIVDESRFAMKSDSQAKALFEGFDLAAISAGKHRWAEKTPLHIHHLDKILHWHPDGRVLLIVRDGRDVAWSIRNRTGSLEQGIDRWVNDNRAGKPYWNHPNVHRLRYEDLIADFETTAKKIVDFLDEPFEESMRHHHSTPLFFYSQTIERPPTAFGRDHRQYRNWQINQPIFDGRGRWKELTPSELAMIRERAGSMPLDLGYEWD